VKSLLDNYIKPKLDISIEEELKDFIKIKKDSMPDSFV
jgi:trimethylamine:corrinoid methyltransferase-like protein